MYSDKSYEDYINNFEISEMRRDWNKINADNGYKYKCYSLENTSGTVSITYSQSPFSTEAQIKEMHNITTGSNDLKTLYAQMQNKNTNQLLELGELSENKLKHSSKNKLEEYKKQEIIL